MGVSQREESQTRDGPHSNQYRELKVIFWRRVCRVLVARRLPENEEACQQRMYSRTAVAVGVIFPCQLQAPPAAHNLLCQAQRFCHYETKIGINLNSATKKIPILQLLSKDPDLHSTSNIGREKNLFFKWISCFFKIVSCCV